MTEKQLSLLRIVITLTGRQTEQSSIDRRGAPEFISIKAFRFAAACSMAVGGDSRAVNVNQRVLKGANMSLHTVNPFEDSSYWSDLREEQREDSRCSECGGFAEPARVRMDDPECRCPEALAEMRQEAHRS